LRIDNYKRILLADDFNQYPFPATAVKFTVKYLLPGSEIQLSIRNCHYYLSAHDLPFHVSISIVLAHIMAVLAYWFMGCQLFEPDIVIMMESGFIIINEY
jgi:hypothetical protein